MKTCELESNPASRTGLVASEWLTPVRFGGILALFLLGAFPKVALGLHSFVYRDYGVLAYPFIHYAHESFWRGELPLWNPLSNCGAPFLAQWGTMALYRLLFLLLVMVAAHSAAAQTTITFEEFPSSTELRNQYAPKADIFRWVLICL